MKIRVNNLARYQTFRDRRPAWVKMDTGLPNHTKWHYSLTPEARVAQMMIVCLAMDNGWHDGKLDEAKPLFLAPASDPWNLGVPMDSIVTELAKYGFLTVLEDNDEETDQAIDTSQLSQHSCVLKGGELRHVTKTELEYWKGEYPTLDVDFQFRKMARWCDTEVSKRKTSKGFRSFVRRWLDREEAKGKPKQGSTRTGINQRDFS